MTQLTSKTAQRLKILKEQINFLKQGCLEKESLGAQLCNDKWNCYECELKIKAEKREIDGILFQKNELKEIMDLDKTDCWKLWKFVDNLIQEIESVE